MEVLVWESYRRWPDPPIPSRRRIIACQKAIGGVYMAKTKQFTVTLENRPGALAEVARTLGNAKVNILALLGTAQGTSGTVDLVVEDTRRAKKALDESKVNYHETIAEEYELPNKPGALAECLDKLATRGINLNSICATVSKGGRKAVVVYRVEAAEVKAAPAA
jgi:hypothetical protein